MSHNIFSFICRRASQKATSDTNTITPNGNKRTHDNVIPGDGEVPIEQPPAKQQRLNLFEEENEVKN